MAGDRELKAMEITLAGLQPLNTEERQRVFDWLVAKLNPQARLADDASGDDGMSVGAAGDLRTIKLFLKQKRPDEDVARATALAYFLTHGKSQATYKTSDLSKARSDAALPAFNMSRALSTAQRAGYLTTAGKRGIYQITSVGEALVEAMPDEGLIKKVKAQGTKRRRRSVRAGATSKKGTTRKR
jgi:hypothetical protein